MFGSKKRKLEELERQRKLEEERKLKEAEERKKEEEKAAFEKEYKEKILFNQTVNTLKKAMKKYEEQVDIFIRLAREAKTRGLNSQYNMAKNGLKIVIDSRNRVSAMYMSLTVSNQIKQVTKDTKVFVNGMSSIAKQLSEINSELDFSELQMEYGQAMAQITLAEEKLNSFSENIYDAIEEYSGTEDDSKISKALDDLIGSDLSPLSSTVADSAEDVAIDSKMDELEALINGK